MPRLQGLPPSSNGGYDTGDFYDASKSNVYPTFRSASRLPKGGSQYATPELEAAARPFKDVGKVNVNLFPGTPKAPLTSTPQGPGALTYMQGQQLPWMDRAKGESIGGIPGAGIVAGGIDFLSNLTGNAMGVMDKTQAPTQAARDVFARLQATPDEQLTEAERQVKSLNQGLFANPPDSPVMQGKQVAEVYKAYQIAEAHGRGESALLNPESGMMGPLDQTPLSTALTGYGAATNILKRGLGSGVPFFGGISGDQLKELQRPDATEEMLGEERWEIKKKLDAGVINESEARDLIARSSFALSNPNPIQLEDWLGPVDTVANAALALIGEVASDPLSIPAAVATGGGALAKGGIQKTLDSIIRSVVDDAIEAEAKALGKTGAEHLATAAGQATKERVGLEVTTAAEEHAAEVVGRNSAVRWLPKSATAAAKQTGRVSPEGISQMDRVEALLDMGSQSGHKWASGISRGIDAAGMSGQVAVKAPSVIKMGQAIDKMTDPFSLFGYWRTGRTVPQALSKEAAHGYMDGIGWRVSRRLDSMLADAGVDPELHQRSRDIAASNHTVQAGDRANRARAVAQNGLIQGPETTPTAQALRHAERRPGDIRRLVRDQVDRTLEFIVPTGKGGRREAMGRWRERAIKQLMDFGATEENARRVAARIPGDLHGERMLRALANDHWGLMIDKLDVAKRAALAHPTVSWPVEKLQRITFMGPRQMAQQDLRALKAAIKTNDIAAVRAAVRRFDSLSRIVSESLPDSELMAEVDNVLTHLDGKLPVRIEDKSDMPSELVDVFKDREGYELFLRPEDNDLVVPIRHADDGRIKAVETFLDNVTDRTPSIEVTRAKAWREGLFRGISGGELERNVSRRFAHNMGEIAGLSEDESARLLRTIREMAEDTGVGKATGMTANQIYKAVDRTPGLTVSTKMTLTKREVVDALLDAYENEMRLVGVLPKLTGWTKKHLEVLPGGGNVRWLSDFLYPVVRFVRNPLFFMQEVPEAPFFLALQGRYPISNIVPDPIAVGLERVPGVRRYFGISQKERTRLWNGKTRVLMDRMSRVAANAEYDFYEASELARMGLTVAALMTDGRTPLGRMLQKVGPEMDLTTRKNRSVELATREELGEQWRRSLMHNAPEQWNAVRAFYPKEMSDAEVAVEWALDTMARADPDSIYSTGLVGLFQPSHIGRRAEVSDILLRRFVYGEADARNHTWEDLVADIHEGRVGKDHVQRALISRGADPDYVERAVAKLTFGSAEEFYESFIAHGVTQDAVDDMRLTVKKAADLMGITEHEYLTRKFVGKPLSVDQMGNPVGETLFDDIVESMRVRGKSIPDSNSPEVAGLKSVSRQKIEGVFPVPDEVTGQLRFAGAEGAEAPLTAAQKEATRKVREWTAARTRRTHNPLIGAPPSRNIEAQVAPARFGRDEKGNALVPDVFESKPGYVYRTVHSGRMGSDWRVGEYAAKHPATIYASDDEHVVLRVKQTVSDWADSEGGVGAHENVQSQRVIPAAAVEVLGEDGKWRPVQAPAQRPEALYQTDLHTIGIVTPEQYRRQIETAMDPEAMSKYGLRAMTEKDALLAIEWYDHIRRSMFALVDDALDPEQRIDEAARILIAFGTTQMNTSPADGFRHVFTAYGMKARGETLQLGEAQNIIQQAVGLNPQQLQRLVWEGGDTVEAKGLGQKLFDFIDSLTGSTRRTNGILGPNGNWGPVAVDIHTKRDLGFLDPAMGDWVYRLVAHDLPGGEVVRGLKSKYVEGKGFVVEMSDGTTEIIPPGAIGKQPTDDEYDYAVELANDIRDHFNATNFMGREWTSYEVQAIGWYRMQLLKSSEGDMGAVDNALFEHSRWMGSRDLSPSVHAPMNEVHPWDVLSPENHRAIHVEGARHASDEAEMLSGARVLATMDTNAVTNGVHRPAQTVELATDEKSAEQWLAHALYLAEQDGSVLMRDRPGVGNTPKYGAEVDGVRRGTGIALDLPVESQAQGEELLLELAGEDGGALRAIGSHSFLARASDGSLHIRTLWEPTGASTKTAYAAAVAASGLDMQAMKARNSMVDFISMRHDWGADPTGGTYLSAIERGSGRHGVMRTPEQRADLIGPYDRAYAEAQAAVPQAAVPLDVSVTGKKSVDEWNALMPEGDHVYHMSDGGNLDSIRAKGLQPSVERPHDNGYKGVFFGNDALSVLTYVASPGEESNIVFRVAKSKTRATSKRKEFISDAPVPPGDLEVLTADGWKPLLGADAATIKAAQKAVATAKKEAEVARAAPGGRPTSEVRELVGSARVRVRETVRASFDKHAPREVRHERERVIGEARDANADALGTDPTWDDVLDGVRGTNGERLYDRTPGGTVRAAITRSDATTRRTQLYLNRAAVTDKSLLHELIHAEAWEMDDSAVRAIKGVHAGLEGTPYGTHTPGAQLTEEEHEWLVSQFMLWVDDPNSVHPVLQPLMNHFRGKLGSISSLKAEATAPSRAAIKSLDADLLRLQTRRAKLKQPAAIAKVDAEIAANRAQRKAAATEAKALRATGGLSPEVKKVLDDIAARAGERKETRASTYSVDESDMMEWMQIAMASSQRRANDLVHMRGERSALERSINHPFLGLYPSSYMWGKVLPYMTEFLMARPFGAKAPFLGYTVGNRMHQSFQRQQEYDEDLRNYLYRNEPFLRAMSLLVPGLPWDMPAAMPYWSRRLMESWLTNAVREQNGQKPKDIDIMGLIGGTAAYQLTLRGPESWEPIWDAVKPFEDEVNPKTGEKESHLAIPKAGELFGSMLGGEAPQPQQP